MRAAKVRKAPRLVASDTTSIVKDQPAKGLNIVKTATGKMVKTFRK